MDGDLRDAERRLVALNARAGRLVVIRPTGEEELPSDPWDGEERLYSFRLNHGVLRATGNMSIQLFGSHGGMLSELNGKIEPCHDSPCVVRLMALLKERVWVSTLLHGTWTVT